MPGLKKMTRRDMINAEQIRLSSTKKSVVTYNFAFRNDKYITIETFYKIDDETRKMLDDYDPYILNREQLENMYR